MASVADHVHITPISLIVQVAIVLAVFGTLHLFALTNESRFSRALIALGF